jgi:hypothetical protein
MRAYELIQFLVEYNQAITKQKLGDKLVLAAEKDKNQDVDTIIDTLEKTDPTKNKQYMVWLANQYIKNQFRLEDYPRIKQALTDFEKLKSRLPQKDINQYTLHSLEDTIDKIKNVELGSGSSAGLFEIPEDSEVLYNGPYGLLVIPKTEEASCELGKGTKWCTAAEENNMFPEYSEYGPLYIWRDRNGKKYQFQFETTQFMDAQDRKLDSKTLNYFRTEHPVLKKLFANKEKEIAQDPQKAFSYARFVLKGRFPEGEEAIAQNSKYAYYYATGIIKDRWPEGEEAIALNGYLYKHYEEFLKNKDTK